MENEVLRVERFFKYILILIIYIFIFIKWKNENLELFLLMIFCILNISTYTLLYFDILTSPKQQSTKSLFIIYLSIIIIIFTNIHLFLILIDISKTYNISKFIPFKLQDKNHDLLNDYKNLSVLTSVLLFIWCFLYFTLHKEVVNKTIIYAPFFNYKDIFDNSSSKEICTYTKIINYTELFMFIFKVIITTVLFASTLYMLYIARKLRMVNQRNGLINVNQPSTESSQSTEQSTYLPPSSNPTVYSKNDWFNYTIVNDVNKMFENLNLNYLINGITQTYPNN